MRAPHSFSVIGRVGNTALTVSFALLCVRSLFAACHGGDWSLVMLGAAGLFVGWWRPAASLFALILSFTLVSGLERTVLHASSSMVLTMASSLWLGLTAHRLFPALLGDGPQSEQPANQPNRGAGRMTLVIEILAVIALLSVFVQIWRQSAAPGFWSKFCHQDCYGTDDPAYFLTSGFLWLHGLFYFRAIREHPGSDIVSPAGIKLAFLVNGIVLLFFHGVQWLFELPARWNPGFESPYEDIATLGIMAACFLLLCLSLLRRDSAQWLFVLVPGAVLLAIAVGFSWSRGAWLAAASSLCALAFVRLPRSLAILLPAVLLGAVVLFNLNSEKISLTNRQYLGKLAYLIRFETPKAKMSARFDLYQKALAMIHDRPWTGHGIGSFSLRAPAYAKPGDLYGALHQLPHNLFLQLAAEQGIPVALMFLSLVGWTLWRGVRCWIIHRHALTEGTDQPQVARSLAVLAMALSLVLGAYLQANMTWDILLVHPTQPFFFWFLVAALWATLERVDVASPSVAAAT